MIHPRHRSSRQWPALVLASAVGVVLAGCGGGSGDDDPFDLGNGDLDGDVNGDGVIDSPIGEPDENGVQAYDIDGDTRPDRLLGFQEYDVNDDGFADFDIDGDGFVDRSVAVDGELTGYDLRNLDNEPVTGYDGVAVVDANGDPLSTAIEPSAENPCGGEPGTDPDSSTNGWGDNCEVSRFGQFEDSLYSAGVQRILWCTGFGGTSTGVDAFTDGEFGPGTQAALEAFQTENGLTSDGIVGPATWQALRDQLTEDPIDVAVGGGDETYGVQGDRCEDIPLFLNEVSFADSELVMGGWQLTKGATDDAPVPFSIASPFGRID